MGRYIVLVLDGFGIGAMDDVAEVRPSDLGSNTCLHIFEKKPELRLQALEQLGLANALGQELETLHFSKEAVFGKAELMHFWADTFFGHQEIMGTLPRKTFGEPIKHKIAEMDENLRANGYHTRFYEGQNERFLIVNEAVTVADNMEADAGAAYNVSGAMDLISFEEIRNIGEIVRAVAVVPRVITFGGRGIALSNLLGAVKETGEYIGVGAPESGIYDDDYHCVHMGYGVNPDVQVTTILGKENIPVKLFGKVADVVINDYGQSFPGVDTAEVMDKACLEIEKTSHGFFCINVQETDLSGHAQDTSRYAHVLQIADEKLSKLMKILSEEDILVVMADHGNDPTIGHSHHTRECVPLLIYQKNGVRGKTIGTRKSLSDVGATAADYFSSKAPENGESFLSLLKK